MATSVPSGGAGAAGRGAPCRFFDDSQTRQPITPPGAIITGYDYFDLIFFLLVTSLFFTCDGVVVCVWAFIYFYAVFYTVYIQQFVSAVLRFFIQQFGPTSELRLPAEHRRHKIHNLRVALDA